MNCVVDRIEIHTLRLSQTDLGDWTECLDASEEARAGRYVKPADRDRFRLGRGLLRTMLGKALGIAPGRLAFRADRHGKPILPAPCPLAFNVSHSGDLACVALGEAASIGIDIERRRQDFDPMALGFHVLTARELRDLELAEDRFFAFFEAWVRKEAMLKGIGTGLLKDPREIEISHGADGPRITHAANGGPDPTQGWQLRSIALPDDYHGALAVLHS
jgi:4'-phosphopantetheinyl transferase